MDAGAARSARRRGRPRGLARVASLAHSGGVARLRPLGRRRQGPHHRGPGGPRCAEGRGPPAQRQPEAVLRGRGGGRLAAHGRGPRREPRDAARRPLASLRRPRAPEPADAGVLRRPRRDRRRGHRLRSRPRAAQRALRELGAEPGPHAGPSRRGPARRGRPRPRARLLRRRAPAHGGRAAGRLRGARRRGRAPARHGPRRHRSRRRAPAGADPPAGPQRAGPGVRSCRRVRDELHPHRGAGLDRHPPRARPDAGEGPVEDRGAPARPRLHRRPRGPGPRDSPHAAAHRAPGLGRGLPRRPNLDGPAGIPRRGEGAGRGAGRARGAHADPRGQRAHVPVPAEDREHGHRPAHRQPRRQPARRQREPPAAEPVGRHRRLRGDPDRPGCRRGGDPTSGRRPRRTRREWFAPPGRDPPGSHSME